MHDTSTPGSSFVKTAGLLCLVGALIGLIRRQPSPSMRPKPALAGATILIALALAIAASASAFARPALSQAVAPDYVVLGGSLSCGFNDSGGGFPERYATLYGEDHPGSYPQVTNLCKPNTPSDAMIATLSEPTTQDALSKADIISLDNGAIEWLQARWSYKAGSCGGADGQDCLRTLYDRYTANRKVIDDAIDASRQPGSLVFATHYYNPWTAEDMGADTYAGDGGDDDFTVLSRYLRALSDYSEADAQARGWRFVDLGLMFNGANFDADMLAAGYTTPTDRIHLTSEGHAEWAEAMREETP
jgi:hypothetical protein